MGGSGFLQGGPLPVINRVITPISRVITFTRLFIGAPFHSIYNNLLGAHLVGFLEFYCLFLFWGPELVGWGVFWVGKIQSSPKVLFTQIYLHSFMVYFTDLGGIYIYNI